MVREFFMKAWGVGGMGISGCMSQKCKMTFNAVAWAAQEIHSPQQSIMTDDANHWCGILILKPLASQEVTGL